MKIVYEDKHRSIDWDGYKYNLYVRVGKNYRFKCSTATKGGVWGVTGVEL